MGKLRASCRHCFSSRLLLECCVLHGGARCLLPCGLPQGHFCNTGGEILNKLQEEKPFSPHFPRTQGLPRVGNVLILNLSPPWTWMSIKESVLFFLKVLGQIRSAELRCHDSAFPRCWHLPCRPSEVPSGPFPREVPCMLAKVVGLGIRQRGLRCAVCRCSGGPWAKSSVVCISASRT